MPDIPVRFRPLYLRSGIKFQNLKDHVFSTFEIVWICGEISKTNPIWDLQIVSIPAICRRYRINTYGLRLWYQMFKNNITFQSHSECFSSASCPIDSIGMRQIYKFQKTLERCPLELERIVQEQIAATTRRSRAIIYR